jgi:DNA invertase Pin-like site-specific DNA recombinase
MTTALLALRDSTDHQDVQRQRQAGHAYATKHGLQIVHEVVDYISGTVPIFDRPGGREILEWVAGRRAQAIIFDSISRVAREEHPVSAPMLRSALAHAGMELHYVDKGKADLSPYGGIIDYIGAVQAGEERKNILRQTNEGKLTHVRAGSVLTFRAPPYGYIVRSDQRQPPGFRHPFRFYWLEINEVEARIVRQIFDWYVHGDLREVNGHVRRTPMSLDAIARRLAAERVPTKSETSRHTPRKLPAFIWSATQVRNILKRETYIGIWHYRKTATVKAPETKRGWRQVARPESEWISVDVPAILITDDGQPDTDLFLQAQERLREMADESPRRLKTDYLLRTRCKCGRCGHAVGSRLNDAGNRKYICTHKKPIHGSARCTLPTFDGDALEGAVWRWVQRIVSDPNYLRETLDDLNRDETREATLANAQKRLGEIERDISTLDRAAAGLLDLLNRADNAFTPEQINNQQRENRRRLDGLRTERARVQSQISNLQAAAIQAAAFEETAGELRAGVLHATEEDKQAYLAELDVRVRIEEIAGAHCAFISCVLFEEGREVKLIMPSVKPGRYARRVLSGD